MAVEVANRTKAQINNALIKRSIELTLKFGKRHGDVSVVIIGDAEMKRLNKRYRGKNTATDILSFTEAESEAPAKHFIGELVIDYLQIKRQAKEFGHSISYELSFIVIHGALHLLGYEDETEKGRRQMEKLGEGLIKKISV